MRCKHLLLLTLSMPVGPLFAQNQPPGADQGSLRARAAEANALMQHQNFVSALPLYEDLHAREPGNVRYEEGLALCLAGMAAQQEPAQAAATRDRARKLLRAARAAGDNSNLIQVLTESLGEADAAPAVSVPGQELVEQGEKAFTRGDLPGALASYRKALEVNPRLYIAALFAGDAEFKQDHLPEAGTWFARAIAIDPNTETAHRYWGDALDKGGNHQHAEEEFIAAVVAEPYRRASRVGLKQWADRNHAQVLAPAIQLPPDAKVAPGKDGKEVVVTLSGAGSTGNPEQTLNLAYSLSTAAWHGTEFHKAFPKEAAYRHSLPEVVAAVQAMLAVAREQHIADGNLSPSVKLLRELDSKGMLACWVLLDDADAGIAQDYAAYRDAHRALLAQYIAQYDIHPM